jgi:ribonuclease P protein component
VHLLTEADVAGAAVEQRSQASRVGLVVGRSVGCSVVRHRVSRRLRAQLRQRLDVLPNGCRLVVRALPETAAAPSASLGRDLDRALSRLTGASVR